MSDPEFFDADAVEIHEEPACTFKLGGREWTCRNRDTIETSVFEEVFGSPSARVREFFSMVLVPDQVDDFVDMIEAPDWEMPLGRIQQLSDFVTAQVLNRPTGPRERSGSGPRHNGRTSAAGSPSRATRRARSAG